MGRPLTGGSDSTGLKQEDSEIPVAYSDEKSTPLTSVKVPEGPFEFALADK